MQVAKELFDVSFIKSCSNASSQSRIPISYQTQAPSQVQSCSNNSLLQWISADEVTFGAMNDHGAQKKIHWKVLEKKTDRVLLISKEGVVSMPFHQANQSICWKDCTLRKWLNYDFINMAFSAQEKALLCFSKVSAHTHLRYDIDAGPETWDNVFVLSQLEAAQYLSSDLDRTCYASRLAIEQGALTKCRGAEEGNVSWWLRTPSKSNTVAYVLGRGAFGSTYPNERGVTVRPALWVKL